MAKFSQKLDKKIKKFQRQSCSILPPKEPSIKVEVKNTLKKKIQGKQSPTDVSQEKEIHP
jgi:hypothetical protein